MKPVLYKENTTAFTTNGLGTLSDVVSCVVTEERNGAYELEMEYPIDGIHVEDIKYSRIIYATPSDGANKQPFRIYAISKPIDGIITVNAEHISYQLAHIPCGPFTAQDVIQALVRIKDNALEDCPFTFWTDKTTVASYDQDVPASIRSRLGGSEGSILDVYSGEYEWDGYTVKLHNNRGVDNGVTLRYGKNIIDINQEESIANTITGVVPYFKGSDGTVVTLPENAVYSPNADNFPYNRTIVMDFSSYFENTVPTVEQLRARANTYINASGVGVPNVNLTISFVPLWQTEEYKNVAVLERVKLCDTVHVYFEKLGIEAHAKVIKTEYDVLLERYNSIELGEARSKMSMKVSALETIAENQVTMTDMERAIDTATNLITGGLGGYVVINKNADGLPEEILVMDSADIHEAVHVIRINKNGIGFSSNGYNGPFRTAWTIDGSFVADFITSGTISANLIKGGVLKLGGAQNVNGQIYIYDSSGEQVGVINNNGIAIYSSVNQKQVLISPIVGFVERDASDGTFEGIIYDGYVNLPALTLEKQRTMYTGVENDSMDSQVIGTIPADPLHGSPLPKAWYKYWWNHVSSYWSSLTSFPTGPTSVTVQLPDDFKGKNFSVSVGIVGIDESVQNNGYRNYIYNHTLPKCKGDGSTWSESQSDADTYIEGVTKFNYNSNVYKTAHAYQGTTSTHFNPIPNDYTVAVQLNNPEITSSELNYSVDQANATITVTGWAKIGDYNYNELAKIRVLAIY